MIAPTLTAHRTEDLAAFGAPTALFLYAVLRYVDGIDGNHGPGWAWTVGHLCFLAAMLCFAAFALLAARHRSAVMQVLAGTVVVGVAAFCWVILGDLLPSVDALDAPDPVMAAGPVLLIAGFLPVVLVVARERVKTWLLPPLACLAGFALVGSDLDLLPFAATAFLGGLFPLALASQRKLS